MSASMTAPRDPMRELIERMNQHRHALAAHDPRLSQQIEGLVMNRRTDAGLGDPEFRTRVAYIYQDFSRLAGPAGGLPEGLRKELEERASTAPGLTNQRIHELLREVPGLRDSKLAGDIRRLAVEVGREGGDQSRTAVIEKIEPLEARVALLGATHTTARSAASDSTARPASGGEGTSPTGSSKPEEPVKAVKSPGEGPKLPDPVARTEAPTRQTPGPLPSPAAPQPSAIQAGPVAEALPSARTGGLLGRAMVMMADPLPATRPPWDREPTPLGERIERMVGRFSDTAALGTAEKSGQKAVEALQEFSRGAGAALLARINEAARSDPQGLQGVLSEMREGGRHADLRVQFNNAIVQDKGAAHAYEAAASAVKQYGTDRQAAEAVLLKRPDDVLAGRFARLDAQIGEAGAQVPARQEGKSIVEELGQRVADLVRRATEAVRSVLQGEPRQAPVSSSGPSPGP